MYLYAIKELNSELYISCNGINYSLKPLGILSNFYKTRQSAARAITTYVDGYKLTPIANNLAWGELEERYKTDRWLIPLSKEEFREVRDSFDLKIVKLCIEEVQDEET